MALSLTLLSIALCYFSPAEWLPGLAPYHIQQFIIGLAVAISVFVVQADRGGVKTQQTALLLVFWFAVVVSVLSRGWLRASLTAFLDFGLVVCIYFLVAINAFSIPRIKIFCRVISLCALVMAILALFAYFTGFQAETLMIDNRVRGYGVLNDPNDFSQFLLIGLSFLGLSWRKHKLLTNIALVILPASLLIVTIYLTGSRGAIFGLVAIVFVMTATKVGKGTAIVTAGIFFALLLVGRFGGGRDISLHEGSAVGRVMAWGSGISQLKSDPLFGVGVHQFEEYNDLTAHNSFVLCFAELGVFGYFFWLALLVTTISGVEALAKVPPKTPDDQEYIRCLTVVRVALYTFLATSWFLSRTYHETLYIILALAAVLIAMRKDNVPSPFMPMMRWVPVTFVAMAGSILIIYATIRLKAF
jgi:putative inorganic carbon (hco3(-)) transporter